MIGDRFGGLLEVDAQTRRRQNFESAIIKVKGRFKGFYPSELTIPCPNGTAKLSISRTLEVVHLKASGVVNHSDHHNLGVGRVERSAELPADAPTLRCLPAVVDLTARIDLQPAPTMRTASLVGLMENMTLASPNLQPTEALTQHQPHLGLDQVPTIRTESTVPTRPYTLPMEAMKQHLSMSEPRREPQCSMTIPISPADSRMVGDQGLPHLGVQPHTIHDDENTCHLNAPLTVIQTTSPVKSKGNALMGEGTNAQLEMSNIDARLWHVFDQATVQDVGHGPWRLMFESQLNVINMSSESQIEEGDSVVQSHMSRTGDFSVGMIRSTAGVEQANQRGDGCSLFNESEGEAGLDDFGIEVNATLQGLQEEGQTQLDAKSQSDDSGESREIEVGVDMDEIIAESLEERILKAQLVDTSPTEPLTGNLIEKEVEAIQHLTQSRAAQHS
ncbi:hypothetical protein Syun_013899 [Stephania yunnanensis]|uniref:Uncharacterized protein n=1 Tax=Stephania yunnanensis TaxID=152371 RepID=A0AAP0JIQ8_9MAGN